MRCAHAERHRGSAGVGERLALAAGHRVWRDRGRSPRLRARRLAHGDHGRGQRRGAHVRRQRRRHLHEHELVLLAGAGAGGVEAPEQGAGDASVLLRDVGRSGDRKSVRALRRSAGQRHAVSRQSVDALCVQPGDRRRWHRRHRAHRHGWHDLLGEHPVPVGLVQAGAHRLLRRTTGSAVGCRVALARRAVTGRPRARADPGASARADDAVR